MIALYLPLIIVTVSNYVNRERSAEPGGYLAVRLSYDHRAEDESEQQRIKNAGGFIARGRLNKVILNSSILYNPADVRNPAVVTL